MMRYIFTYALLFIGAQSFAQSSRIDYLLDGVSLYNKGDYPGALSIFKAGLEKGADSNTLMQLKRNMGNAYSQMGQTVAALKYYQEAIQLSELLKDSSSTAHTLVNIGAMYEEMKNFPEALKYYSLGENLARAGRDSMLLADVANNKGLIYEQQNKFPKALDAYRTALQIYQKKNIRDRLALSYNNMGVMYKNMNQYADAILYYTRSKEISEELGDQFMISANLINIGNVYEQKKDYKTAIRYNEEGLKIAREINALNIMTEAAINIANDHKNLGNFKEAYQWQQQYLTFHDSLFNSDKAEQLATLQTQFETIKKEKEIEALKNKEQINALWISKQALQLQKRSYMIGGILILIICSVIVAYILYKKQRLQQAKEQERMLMQMEHNERIRIARDVHDDLGSGLSRIAIMANMASNKLNRQELATNEVNHIAGLSRNLIDSMRDLIWVMDPENNNFETLLAHIREFCSDYLEENNILFQLEVKQEKQNISFPREVQRNIFLTIKEFVHNTVNYAHAGTVFLSIKADHDSLQMNLRDDGDGFDIKNIKPGNGLGNMQQRIESSGGEFDLIAEMGKGVRLFISLPLQESETKKGFVQKRKRATSLIAETI